MNIHFFERRTFSSATKFHIFAYSVYFNSEITGFITSIQGGWLRNGWLHGAIAFINKRIS